MIVSVLSHVRLLYQQESYDGALDVLERYAETNELTAEMLVLKGRLIQLSDAGRYELAQAERCFLDALTHDARSIEAMLELGWLYLNVLGRPSAAREYFSRVQCVAEEARKDALEGLREGEGLDLH